MGNTKAQGRLSARRVATFLAALGVLVMSSGAALMVTAGASSAAVSADCVPQAAYTETINHPAETHVVHHAAVPGTPDLWWNWSPNKDQAPFDGEPGFPDPRGTWEGPHQNGGPDQDTYGTFNSSHGESGRASWFHREHGTAGTPAWDETVVDKAAWVETINHPAVTCPVVEGPTLLTPQAPTFTPATCTTPASVTLPQQAVRPEARMATDPVLSTSDANGFHYVATGSLAPGGTVVVNATLTDEGAELAPGAQTSWTFPVVAPNCPTAIVSTPTQVDSAVVVSPPKAHVKSHVKAPAHAQAATVTPSVVEAGLASTTTQDLRSEQGLALVVAGMVMLIGAGGLTLRVRRAAARI